MIRQSAFPAEPWAVRETRLERAHLAQTESVFALGNGHIGLRGNLDEGEPFGLPGTYLGGFCEVRPLESAEPAYGQPQVSETVLNVTNGKLMRLLVDDEPLDIRYGELRSHERLLDLRAGTLSRSVEWVSPTGHAVRVRTTRLVSFAQRAVAAILYEVEPLQERLAVVVQSELVANEPLPDPDDDPRAGSAHGSLLRSELVDGEQQRAILAHSTAVSDLTMAAAMDHTIEAPPGYEATLETHPDIARLAVACELEPGQKLRIVKLLAYGWSAERTVAALRDQVGAALAGARRTGWQGLLDEQRAFLDRFWERADVEIDGDDDAAAGGALRAVPRAAGGRARRAARDRGEGTDRPRIRRAHLLGHRDVRAAGAHVHGAAGGR